MHFEARSVEIVKQFPAVSTRGRYPLGNEVGHVHGEFFQVVKVVIRLFVQKSPRF